MSNIKDATPPWHTGLLEGAVWGGLVRGAVGLAGVAAMAAVSAVTGVSLAAPAMLVTGSVLGIVGSVAGVTMAVNKISDKRDEYKQAHSVIDSASSQHQGMAQSAARQSVHR